MNDPKTYLPENIDVLDGSCLEQIGKKIKDKPQPIENFVYTNKDRIWATGVYHKDGYKVATDTFILVKIRSNYPEDNEGKCITPQGKEINATFGIYDKFFNSTKDEDITINTSQLISELNALCKYIPEFCPKITNNVFTAVVDINGYLFNAHKLLKVLQFAKEQHFDNVKVEVRGSDAAPFLKFIGENGGAVIVGICLDEFKNNIVYFNSNTKQLYIPEIISTLPRKRSDKVIETFKTKIESV